MKKILLASALVFAQPALAQTVLSEEEIKKLALEAILENPDIVMEAARLVQERQKIAQAQTREQFIKENIAVFTDTSNAPYIGNPDGDVTIVEFFDYNCSYCRKGFPYLQELVETDPNVKIVFREFPILSEGSVVAAKASLAALNQGKYTEFHTAMMADDIAAYSIEEPTIMEVAEQIGLDIDQMKADMESDAVLEHIAISQELAKAVEFNGTPAFIIGTTPVGGLIDLKTMQEIIKETRSNL